MSRKQFPIKYIENNLVFNQKGEVFAYYELIPYNYSFLSPEQKEEVGEYFRQMVAQNRDGKIHALQIATESSVRHIQEMCKDGAKGKYKELLCSIIDDQTEAITGDLESDIQVDYRYFIGFKLIPNQEELSLKYITKEIKSVFHDFVNEVNHSLMGDFIEIENAEVERYSKLEALMRDKIARRFQIRALTDKDFGYLVQHLHGQENVPYEEYDFTPYRKKLKKITKLKRYDLLRLRRCVMTEKPRSIILENEESREKRKLYVSYLTINHIVGELDFPSSEVLYYQQKSFSFPVDTSINVEIVSNKNALTVVRNKKKELKDLEEHAYQSDNETSNNVIEAMDSVDELEGNLDKTKESMYKLSYVIRVSADSEEELTRRIDVVKDFYDGFNIKLVCPYGDMKGLHEEFIPSNGRYINDYVQYTTSDFLAGLGFGSTQMLGEKNGIYIGKSLESGRNVYLRPELACQGVKGSVTNALAIAFLGSLGGGKSFFNNLLMFYCVLFGARALVIDPKSERGGWQEAFPWFASEINIVNLTSEEENQGLLDPFVIMKNRKDAESLAIDILSYLTDTKSRDRDRFPLLRKAVKKVSEKEEGGLLLVIGELRKMDDVNAIALAEHIESFTDFDFARLLFSDGTAQREIGLDNQINILQVADLVLPDVNTKPEEYSSMEILSVAMMIVISTFSLNFIKEDRSVFKITNLDEAWSFLNVAQGKILANKLVRAGRSMQAGVWFSTQNCDDLMDEKMKNNIGLKFAFRSRDPIEIKKTLSFLGVDSEDEENQRMLKNLENGQCLMCDLYGHVGRVQIDPVFADFLEGFDTRPPETTEEEETEEMEEWSDYMDEAEEEEKDVEEWKTDMEEDVKEDIEEE